MPERDESLTSTYRSLKIIATIAAAVASVVVWSLLHFAAAADLAAAEAEHQKLEDEVSVLTTQIATLQAQIKSVAGAASVGLRDHDGVTALEVKAGMSVTSGGDDDGALGRIPDVSAIPPTPTQVPSPSPGGPP